MPTGLEHFAHARAAWRSPFTTFIAFFEAPRVLNEAGFEALLWEQLGWLHDLDGQPWDARVSANPDDPRYSFSFSGCAFFVVGMHAGASRVSRRFAWPTLVFNAHEQFEQLRQSGRFAGIQRAIRAREMQLQGSLNPNLSDYGVLPENRQYSGRRVEPAWRCPRRATEPAE